MLTYFHYGLLVGLAIVLIAVLKADYNMRILAVGAILVGIIWYKLKGKRK